MIRNLVAQTLELQDYNVLLAEEGWEAIKVARTHKGKIDVLFTDVVMPGLGGGELALAIGELVKQTFADLGGTVELGEMTVREEARGLLLPTAIFARWSRS